MVVIDNSCLENMKSPIKYVFRKIPNAISNIAPERKAEFIQEFSDFSITYLDENSFICDVLVSQKRIRLSRKVMEILWCCSYGYYIIYNYISKNFSKGVLTLEGIEEQIAVHLISWAYHTVLTGEDLEWPNNLPQPVENPINGSIEELAEEMCLGAIAVLLHHELGHIKHVHIGKTSDEENIKREIEADNYAVDWVFEKLLPNVEQYETKKLKRGCCLTIAYASFIGLTLQTGDFDCKGLYPKSFNRLYNSIEKYFVNDDDSLWFFVLSTLSLHYSNSQYFIENITVFDSPKSAVTSIIEELSEVAND